MHGVRGSSARTRGLAPVLGARYLYEAFVPRTCTLEPAHRGCRRGTRGIRDSTGTDVPCTATLYARPGAHPELQRTR